MTATEATTLVKCCGMFRPQDIDAVNAARPDFCGFVIDFPKSHRSVTCEQARALRGGLDDGIAAVGVFVDRAPEEVAKVARACRLDAVQLHGSETVRDIAELRALLGAQVAIIKAFKVRAVRDLEAADASSADFVLLDNGQGTGEAFDWSLLSSFTRPYFLAGGLTCETVRGAIERFGPFAVDVSSGLETDKLKDPDKIARVVQAVRQAGGGCGAKLTGNAPRRHLFQKREERQ